MTTKRLTQAELARALGVHRSAVTRAIRSGRLTPGPDGLFDFEEARREWRAKTRIHVPRDADEGYQVWRAVKISYQAKIAELGYRRATGELLDKPAVDYALREVATHFRVQIENLADRLAPLIAPVTDQDEIRRIVQRELDEILEDFERVAAKARDELARSAS